MTTDPDRPAPTSRKDETVVGGPRTMGIESGYRLARELANREAQTSLNCTAHTKDIQGKLPSTDKEASMRLGNGDRFPSVSGPTVGGGSLTIPGDLKQGWNVVLFYRGHW